MTLSDKQAAVEKIMSEYIQRYWEASANDSFSQLKSNDAIHLNKFLALLSQVERDSRIEEAKWSKMQFSKLDKSHVGRSYYNRNTAFKNYAVKFWNNRVDKITGKFDDRIKELQSLEPGRE